MGPTEKTPTPRSIICHFPSSQGLSSVVWKHTHVPLLTAVWPRPSAGDNKSCSAWWLSSCHDPTGRGRGDVPSIIYSQWLCKHSVKPGMKWCSLFEIRAQGLWTEDAVTVEFANEGSSPFVSPCLYLLSALKPYSLTPPHPLPATFSPCLSGMRGVSCQPFIVPFPSISDELQWQWK